MFEIGDVCVLKEGHSMIDIEGQIILICGWAYWSDSNVGISEEGGPLKVYHPSEFIKIGRL